MHICVAVLILCPILGFATWVYPRRTPAAWVYPRRTPVSILVWDMVTIWAGIIKYLLRPLGELVAGTRQ